MKKIIAFTALVFLTVSCGESQELTDAKDELLDRTPVVQEEVVEQNTERSENTLLDTDIVSITPLTDVQYLEFWAISEADVRDGEVEIYWLADSWVEKIQVLFSNWESDFPDDDYFLKTFSSASTDTDYALWKSEFKYIASSKNQVLDFWKNIYIFRAYVWKEYSETQITIISQERDEVVWTETQLIGTEDDTLLINLPVSSQYGEPMMLWETSFTYTDIQWLEIKKQIIPELTCESLTDFLGERINSWYYWNTCRETVKDKGIYFNVIRLDGERYIYERHYIDFENGLYATYEMETGVGVDSENIAEKNKELKETEYEIVSIVDGLMRDIISN